MTRRPLYDAVTRSRAAELYDEGHGVLSISNQIGVPYEAVRQWINTYRSVGIEGLTDMGKKNAVYSYETKVAAARAVVDEGMTKAEAAVKLRGEVAEVKAQAESDRIDFKLQLAGVRNVKAARALLADHDNDVEKLKAAEPWLFEATGKHAKGGSSGGSGTTGLPNAEAATDEGKTLKRWREIAGLTDSVEGNDSKKEG